MRYPAYPMFATPYLEQIRNLGCDVSLVSTHHILFITEGHSRLGLHGPFYCKEDVDKFIVLFSMGALKPLNLRDSIKVMDGKYTRKQRKEATRSLARTYAELNPAFLTRRIEKNKRAK